MSISNYQQLASRFGKVRRSWRQAAALSGLAIVVTESIGILTVLLFLDWLYQPLPLLRIVLWVAALGGIAYLLVRHVGAPLTRKISDGQIALYIEEHRQELDGVLITAAEFGQKAGSGERDAEALIEAVVQEATARAAMAARHVVEFSRLKKYGAGALAGIVIYGVLGVLFPQAVGHHFERILNPWRPTTEDFAKSGPGAMFFEPIKFTFSKGDASLARGSSYDFEVTLSRTADSPVVLNFRPRTQGAQWQTLPMKEIEKLNGFQGTLADVSEDLEFQVSCGSAKSETHRVTVFDPLVVQSIDVTTHYPAYVKLPDRIENPSSGDVEALVGSTVTVHFVTSTALKEGTIKWGNGKSQKITVDPKTNTTASVAFEVKEDDTYDYAITDVNGQQASSAASLSLHAIIDQPPTLKVNLPVSPVMTNPLGEIAFDVDADDDFGVAGVDLVYDRLDATTGEPHETRVPLTLTPGDTKTSPNAVKGAYLMSLENAQPAFAPEEAVSYYLEARDGKGQKAISEIGLIIVGYLESWNTWNIVAAHAHPAHPPGGPSLIAMLKAVWFLDTQKPTLEPADYEAQSKEMAALMTDKTTGQFRDDFVDLKHYPQLAPVAPKINLHANNAYKALLVANTAKASVELRIAVAISEGGKLLEDSMLERPTGGTPPPTAGSLTSQGQLEKINQDALAKASQDQAHAEKEKNKAQAAADTAKSIEELIAKQEELLNDSKNGKAKPASLAPTEKEISDKARELGAKIKASAPAQAAAPAAAAAAAAAAKTQQAGEKLASAAAAMGEASKDFAAGNKAEAETKAAAAKKQLEEARADVSNNSREQLEEAVSKAEARAAALLAAQQALRAKTEATATEMGTNTTADQRQARDLKEQAVSQTELHGQAEALNSEIAQLRALAGTVGKPEAVRALDEALLTIKHSQPEKKMANAIVNLGTTTPAAAAEEQKKAEEALAKIAESLRNSADALSATKEEQMKRAARDAKAAKEGLKAAAAAKPKVGENPAAAQQPAAQQAAARQAATQQAAHAIARLAAKLDPALPADQADVKRLQELSKDEAELLKTLLVDKKLVTEVTGIVSRIDDKLEAEIAAKTEAKTILSSQREECPPSYRQFVNKYFEALSQIGRSPEQVKKP